MTSYLDFPTGRFWLGDTLEAMAQMPDASVDMILADLPYGTTACKWDSVLPFDQLWAAYDRICKPRAAVVLTASQPFTSALVMSNVSNFRYTWTWDKVNGIRNHLNAKKQPLRVKEDVCIFYKNQPPYTPQMREGGYTSRKTKPGQSDGFGRVTGTDAGRKVSALYPLDILRIPSHDPNNSLHPTQKPVALFEYLIRTYTNPGDLVLDNTAGSGTTAVAAINTDRRWCCVERDPDYYAKAVARIAACQ